MAEDNLIEPGCLSDQWFPLEFLRYRRCACFIKSNNDRCVYAAMLSYSVVDV